MQFLYQWALKRACKEEKIRMYLTWSDARIEGKLVDPDSDGLAKPSKLGHFKVIDETTSPVENKLSYHAI